MIRKLISCIVPCYNEADVLSEFYSRIDQVAISLTDYQFEFIFVNDGSLDDTPDLLNKLADSNERVKVLHFAKNRGHQAAITAGMDYCCGDYIIIIDADLQDPPELIPEIISKLSQGSDMVHMQRRIRQGESKFKILTASWFYWLIKNVGGSVIIENCGDFRGFTRQVLKVTRGFREQHRFMRGIFGMVGFEQTVIPFDRDSRYAGSTKYSLRNMLSLASHALLSFSSAPLHMIIWLSFFLWFVSLFYLGVALIGHFILKATVPGWTSIIILMTFYTGIILFCLGILAVYISKIFEQGQQRPLYWLSDTRNINLNHLDKSIRETRLSEHALHNFKKK